MTEDQDWFENLVSKAFNAEEAREELENWREMEEDVRNTIREARKDLKVKLDNEVLPPGVEIEWDTEV